MGVFSRNSDASGAPKHSSGAFRMKLADLAAGGTPCYSGTKSADVEIFPIR